MKPKTEQEAYARTLQGQAEVLRKAWREFMVSLRKAVCDSFPEHNPWLVTVQPPPIDPIYSLVWSPTAQRLSREGMVTVWDEKGRYAGCMGAEFWESLLAERVK